MKWQDCIEDEVAPGRWWAMSRTGEKSMVHGTPLPGKQDYWYGSADPDEVMPEPEPKLERVKAYCVVHNAVPAFSGSLGGQSRLFYQTLAVAQESLEQFNGGQPENFHIEEFERTSRPPIRQVIRTHTTTEWVEESEV